MKKFTKVAVVLAVIFAIIGISCVIASFAMGFTWDKIAGMVTEGKFNFAIELDDFHEDKKGVIKGQDDKQGNVIIPNESFRNLDIEFSAGVLEIVYADVENVEVQNKNAHDFKCYIEENTYLNKNLNSSIS